MSEWFSVEKQIPEPGVEVLLLSFCQNLRIHVYNVGSLDECMDQFFSSEMGVYLHPEYWMPLPEPPSE